MTTPTVQTAFTRVSSTEASPTQPSFERLLARLTAAKASITERYPKPKDASRVAEIQAALDGAISLARTGITDEGHDLFSPGILKGTITQQMREIHDKHDAAQETGSPSPAGNDGEAGPADSAINVRFADRMRIARAAVDKSGLRLSEPEKTYSPRGTLTGTSSSSLSAVIIRPLKMTTRGNGACDNESSSLRNGRFKSKTHTPASASASAASSGSLNSGSKRNRSDSWSSSVFKPDDAAVANKRARVGPPAPFPSIPRINPEWTTREIFYHGMRFGSRYPAAPDHAFSAHVRGELGLVLDETNGEVHDPTFNVRPTVRYGSREWYNVSGGYWGDGSEAVGVIAGEVQAQPSL